MRFLFFLFMFLPVIEIILLIKVGGRIGAGATIALVLASAFAGLFLLRRQGVKTLFRINQRLAAGQTPAREMLEGVMMAVGGLLLLLPGFLTDVLGLLCVLPVTRTLFIRSLLKRAVVMPQPQVYDPFRQSQNSEFRQDQIPPEAGRPRRPETIEGEFRREDSER